MKTCVLCGEKAGLFSPKSYSGRLCKSCLSLIPSSVQLSSADTDFLKSVTERTRKRKRKFECTAFYGSLFIDSVHNMFCISKRSRKGEPLSFGDIYYISELTEIGLFCTNVKNIGSRVPKIVCDVKLRVKTEDAFAEYLIASNETCSFKNVKDGIEWDEPAKLSIFRSLFNQMIENEIYGIWERLEEARAAEVTMSRIPRREQWARGVFFFREDEKITDEALKKRRNTLTKLLHPDLNPSLSTNDIMAQINEAYQSLQR